MCPGASKVVTYRLKVVMSADLEVDRWTCQGTRLQCWASRPLPSDSHHSEPLESKLLADIYQQSRVGSDQLG